MFFNRVLYLSLIISNVYAASSNDFEDREIKSRVTTISKNSACDPKQVPSQKNVLSTLQHSQDAIDRAMRATAEAEEIGGEIVDNLRAQTEQIKGISGKATEFQGVSDAARRTVNSMKKREMCAIS